MGSNRRFVFARENASFPDFEKLRSDPIFL